MHKCRFPHKSIFLRIRAVYLSNELLLIFFWTKLWEKELVLMIKRGLVQDTRRTEWCRSFRRCPESSSIVHTCWTSMKTAWIAVHFPQGQKVSDYSMSKMTYVYFIVLFTVCQFEFKLRTSGNPVVYGEGQLFLSSNETRKGIYIILLDAKCLPLPNGTIFFNLESRHQYYWCLYKLHVSIKKN